jgi:hypothetical protein
MVEDVPGSIIECGVYLDNGLSTWSKLLETFSPCRRGDKVFGFDSFEGYVSTDLETKNVIDYVRKIHGHGSKGNQSLVEKLIELNESDNLVPGARDGSGFFNSCLSACYPDRWQNHHVLLWKSIWQRWIRIRCTRVNK